MRANTILFWILAGFMFFAAAVYTFWSVVDPAHGEVEWVGTLTIALSGVLSAFIAFYLGRVRATQGRELPEDRFDANIDDGDAEQGFFSPWSWWPILLAASAALFALGLAIGVWIALFAAGFLLISLVGWVYEYYRGYFSH
jgi:hypothetical protein